MLWNNKDLILQNITEYYIINKDWLLEHCKEYHKLNRDKINNFARNLNKIQRSTNHIYKFITKNRVRTRQALKSNSKAAHTIYLLGCDRYIFTNGFSSSFCLKWVMMNLGKIII